MNECTEACASCAGLACFQPLVLVAHLLNRAIILHHSSNKTLSLRYVGASDVRVNDNTYRLIVSLRDQIPTIRADLHNTVGVGMRAPGIPYTEAKDLKFSGRVFIYTDEAFTVIQLGEMTSWYQTAGLSLQIRGSDYWWANKDR